ncbi:MAG: hypothetical protein GWN56_13005 [Nitrosopumilaceae archaeon]|nr:hypothetical protein [Nitrosopumilaceae archaeon]
MKKLSAILMIITLIAIVPFIAGCENKAKKQEFESTKSNLVETQEQLDKIKQNSEALDKYIANLKSNINELKIENQKLIAESKRLEAEIIDLNLELGKIPSSDAGKDLSSGDSSDKDAPADDESNSDGSDSSQRPDNLEQEV